MCTDFITRFISVKTAHVKVPYVTILEPPVSQFCTCQLCNAENTALCSSCQLCSWRKHVARGTEVSQQALSHVACRVRCISSTYVFSSTLSTLKALLTLYVTTLTNSQQMPQYLTSATTCLQLQFIFPAFDAI